MLICRHWTAKALQALKTPRYARARKEEQRQKSPIMRKARRAFPPAHATAAEYQANAGGKGRQAARPHAGAANGTPPQARGQPAGAAAFAAATSARPSARLAACCITALVLRATGWPPVRRRRVPCQEPGGQARNTRKVIGYADIDGRRPGANEEAGRRDCESKAAHLADDRHCAKAAGKRRGADAGRGSKLPDFSKAPRVLSPRLELRVPGARVFVVVWFRCPLVLNISER